MRREGCLFSGGTREEGAIYLIRLHDVSPCSINTINGDRGGKREETTLGEDISLTRHLQTFLGNRFCTVVVVSEVKEFSFHGIVNIPGPIASFHQSIFFSHVLHNTHPANRRNDSFTHSRISVSRARMGGCA